MGNPPTVTTPTQTSKHGYQWGLLGPAPAPAPSVLMQAYVWGSSCARGRAPLPPTGNHLCQRQGTSLSHGGLSVPAVSRSLSPSRPILAWPAGIQLHSLEHGYLTSSLLSPSPWCVKMCQTPLSANNYFWLKAGHAR